MKRRNPKKRTMTSGSRSLLAIALLILGAAVAIGADKKSGKKSDKNNVEAYALIAGTVFRESGFALPGAEVTLTPEAGEAPNAKNKKLKAISDARGEFAFRVPPLPWRYT